jgi:hypothetical protein
VERPRNSAEQPAQAGLCADCVHARRIESNRGSVFIQCELSVSDPRYLKYPRLPVFSCDGYKKKEKPLFPV